MEIHLSLWTLIVRNAVFLFLAILVLLILVSLKKRRLNVKRCCIIVFACIMLSSGYYCYSTIHYYDLSNKALISLEDALLSSPNINVSCDNNQKSIITLGNQEQRNRIMDIVIESEYKIISHRGIIDAACPIKVCFPDNPDVSLILYGKNLIEIAWKKHKVRLLSNDEELYSKVNMIVKQKLGTTGE